MNDDVLSVISLTISGIALGYPFLKDFWEKPKLKVRAHIAKIYIPGRGEQPEVFSVAITNIGGKPLVIDGHAFEHFDGKNSIFPEAMDQFSRKRLDPYDGLSVTMSNAILQTMIQNAHHWKAFFVCDTKGKKWHLSKKDFKELKANLLKCR
jgi:hypothetical protein